MDKVLSVEDFIGGLLKQGGNVNGSWKMGLGRRTDSEAAFQEFLKRIPSATALSSQAGEESKPMFASGSNASLFGFGSSNLECSGVPRVASLDMLRNMVDQDEKNRSSKRNEAAVQFTGAPDHTVQSPTSLRQQTGGNAQLFQPSRPTISHPVHSLAQSAAMPGPSIPSMPICSTPAMGAMLQVPGTLLAYQNLPHSPQLLPVHAVQHGIQPQQHGKGSIHSDGSGHHGSDEHDKMEQRRARRMLSNRESARRSRKRKQEQLSELEQQVKILEDKNDNLESQCQAAALHVQNILADKQRLENDNQHLMSILQQLQKSIGEEEIRKHLPAALGGTCPISSPAITTVPPVNKPDVSAPALDAAAVKVPLKIETIAAEGVAADGQPEAARATIAAVADDANNETGASMKRTRQASHDNCAEQNGIDPAVKSVRTRREFDVAKYNGTH